MTLLIASVGLSVSAFAQVSASGLNWQAIKGSGDDFYVYFPEGFTTALDGGYSVGRNNGTPTTVERSIIVFRYIGGVALLMEYYEGDASEIQASTKLTKNIKTTSQRSIGDFKIAEVSDTSKPQVFAKIQHYRAKNRLYVLKSTKSPEENEIAKGFFESVRLSDKGQLLAPNFKGEDLTKVFLPEILHKDTAANAVAALEEKDVDAVPVPVHMGRLNLAYKDRPMDGTKREQIKVFCSAEGIVEKTEVIKADNPGLGLAAEQAAKNSFFSPAMKNGAAVPVQKVLDFETTAIVIRALVRGQ